MTRMTLIAICMLAAGNTLGDSPDTCRDASGTTGSAQAPCATTTPDQTPGTDTGTHHRLFGGGAERRHAIVEKAIEVKTLESLTAHQAAARAAVAVHGLRTGKTTGSATEGVQPEPTTPADDGYDAEIQHMLGR